MVNLAFIISLFNAEKLGSEVTSKRKLDCNKHIHNPNEENLGTLFPKLIILKVRARMYSIK